MLQDPEPDELESFSSCVVVVRNRLVVSAAQYGVHATGDGG